MSASASTEVRRRVNLRDINFAHHILSKYCTLYGNSHLFEWDRTCSQTGPTVYTDAFLKDDIVQYSGDKIAWLSEPAAIAPGVYQWIQANYGHFVEIWSHNDDVLRFVADMGVSHVFVPAASCFVDFPSHRVAAKTRMCSFIASDKNWAPGHCLRQQVRSMLPQSVDAFGRGFVYVKNKADALSDYAYSIAIENSQQDTYFTEKLVDCFTTGTVPIYWGTRKIGQYFNPDGVIHFDTVDEIPHILQSLSMEDYQNRMVSILANFETAKRFFIPEEWGVLGSKYLG